LGTRGCDESGGVFYFDSVVKNGTPWNIGFEWTAI